MSEPRTWRRHLLDLPLQAGSLLCLYFYVLCLMLIVHCLARHLLHSAGGRDEVGPLVRAFYWGDLPFTLALVLTLYFAVDALLARAERRPRKVPAESRLLVAGGLLYVLALTGLWVAEPGPFLQDLSSADILLDWMHVIVSTAVAGFVIFAAVTEIIACRRPRKLTVLRLAPPAAMAVGFAVAGRIIFRMYGAETTGLWPKLSTVIIFQAVVVLTGLLLLRAEWRWLGTWGRTVRLAFSFLVFTVAGMALAYLSHWDLLLTMAREGEPSFFEPHVLGQNIAWLLLVVAVAIRLIFFFRRRAAATDTDRLDARPQTTPKQTGH